MSRSEQKFWQWFRDHQDELFDFEADRERVFDQLIKQLNRVHPDLCFEFGPKAQCREFVISAGGLRKAFPAVSSLVASAPGLERWRITAFRPRRAWLSTVQIGETQIEPTAVEFSLLTNDSKIGIQLFIPGANDSNTALKQIGYLMLDEALGEYDVETKLGLIQMLPPEAPHTSQRHPLPELPSLFDQLVSRLAGQPSIH